MPAFVAAALELIPLIVQVAPSVIQATQDVTDFIGRIQNASDPPTDADWAALHEKEKALRTILHGDDA